MRAIHTFHLPHDPLPGRIWRPLGVLALVLGAHLAVAFLLWRTSVPRGDAPPAAIMVNLVPAVRPERVSRPEPVQRRANTPEPARPRAVARPRPAVEEALAGPAERAIAAPESLPPAPLPAPTPVTAPLFNADYLHNPAPVYPYQSRRTGEQGRVVLRVLVSAAGGAEKVEIQTSSGSPRLDQAALEAVRAWRFVPARQGEQAVEAWVAVPINFKLGE